MYICTYNKNHQQYSNDNDIDNDGKPTKIISNNYSNNDMNMIYTCTVYIRMYSIDVYTVHTVMPDISRYYTFLGYVMCQVHPGQAFLQPHLQIKINKVQTALEAARLVGLSRYAKSGWTAVNGVAMSGLKYVEMSLATAESHLRPIPTAILFKQQSSPRSLHHQHSAPLGFENAVLHGLQQT